MKLKSLITSGFDETNYKEFLKNSFGFESNKREDFSTKLLNDNEKKSVSAYKNLGKHTIGKTKLGFFIFQTQSENIENKRVGFSGVIEGFVKDDFVLDGAIVAIYNEKDPEVWRLTFVSYESIGSKAIKTTQSKRYTYVLGENISYYTALQQLGKLTKTLTIEDIKEAFSVEKVSKEFFTEYKKLYFETCDYLQSQVALLDNEKNVKLFTKKLLGRIVFLYFLQKKGWLASDENWKNGDKKFLSECFKKRNFDNFYFDILKPIFFKALNEKRENDYFEPLNCKMPFLNGGLFNKDEFDKRKIILDNSIFEHIFNTFDNYNFTIIEDTPHDSEIAIDPEMLGRVFEDLLEDRKDKGAFYTPREIVHYMSKKSIEGYLKNEAKDYNYVFSVESFLQKTTLNDDEVLKFYKNHPVKFIKIDNYFKELKAYENLVVDFYMVVKLRGLFINEKGEKKGTRTKGSKGHPEITTAVWTKILQQEYKVVAINFGSNKEIRLEKSYKYPTILKYIEIQGKYFTLAFLPNIFGDLELTTIFPIRYKNIQSRLKKFDKFLLEISEKNFAFDLEVYKEIKELREDCRSLHAEPLPKEAEHQRQAVVQKGLSVFLNSFNVDSLANDSLKELLKNKDYYNKSINILLNHSTLSQDKLKDIMIHRLRQIKILDPAIGSGAFPMGVMHEIIEARTHLGDKTPLAKMKREVIENSIYGIDIEPSAVEIAKLRFWLSIVVEEEVEQGESPEPLPNLFYKIMVGNSLLETIDGIDPLEKRKKGSDVENKRLETLNNLDTLFDTFYNLHDKDKKSGLKANIDIEFKKLFDNGLKKYSNKVKLDATKKELDEAKTASLVSSILQELYDKHYSDKIFLYKLFFKEVLDSGGFDLVIGNPPYLRVQGIDKQLSEQYKKIFDSATGSYDLYVLFVEKALGMLSANGIVNYIIPHKWINSSFGKGLREVSKENISKFISFGAYQVFNASTYTSLVWFQNQKSNNYLKYVELDRDLNTNKSLETYLMDLSDDSYTKIQNRALSSDNWTFTNKKTYKILEKLKEQPIRLNEIFEYIQVGTQVMGDEIYHLKGKFQDNKFIGYSEALDKEIVLEKGIMKPLLVGDDVKRYSPLSNKYYMIYPHFLENKKTKPYEEDVFKNKFPLTYKYLLNFKDELVEKKIKYKTNSKYWYSLHRAREITLFEQEKILTPEISLGCNMSLDKHHYYTNTQNYSFVKNAEVKESYKFYLSILNSKLFWFFIKNTGSVLSSGYFRFKTNYLKPFPMSKIKNIEETKPYEDLVDEIMQLKEQGKDTKNLEAEIDKMVYKLYGLSDSDVDFIEGSV